MKQNIPQFDLEGITINGIKMYWKYFKD